MPIDKLDARRWRFLDRPHDYRDETLRVLPLKRQFATAKDILKRIASGGGVLLADDVGLGKTTVAAVVAWVVASQGGSVRIYAPNAVMRRRWAAELERHVEPLANTGLDVHGSSIKMASVGRLHGGRIQVATHYDLVREADRGLICDLLVIDEAHRAKGENSLFGQAVADMGVRATRKLVLTATPFSIRIEELVRLLGLVGATDLKRVQAHAKALKRLHESSEGADVEAQAQQLLTSAEAAIACLRPWVIRHGIEDLTPAEARDFGKLGRPWEIESPAATHEDLGLLLRMDRLMQLAPQRAGERRNDPRFHVGWQPVADKLEEIAQRVGDSDSVAARHLARARADMAVRAEAHPKVAAVGAAIQAVIDGGEKVLVFCHHHATAAELLGALETSTRHPGEDPAGPPEAVWRAAWTVSLPGDDPSIAPIIDWLCSIGLRRQVTRWIGTPAATSDKLAKQFEKIRPRLDAKGVPTIAQAASALVATLLDAKSTSTRKVLSNIANRTRFEKGGESHFPGMLDLGIRTMGAWQSKRGDGLPESLYRGKPDIVMAVFNSPFGPDVLVATDRMSEGVDLHRCCRHLVHYELDPSPARTLQRNGRIRRVGSWAAQTDRPIEVAYPLFAGTRDEQAVDVMKRRLASFGLLLGGTPSLEVDLNPVASRVVGAVLQAAGKRLARSNKLLCDASG